MTALLVAFAVGFLARSYVAQRHEWSQRQQALVSTVGDAGLAGQALTLLSVERHDTLRKVLENVLISNLEMAANLVEEGVRAPVPLPHQLEGVRRGGNYARQQGLPATVSQHAELVYSNLSVGVE